MRITAVGVGADSSNAYNNARVVSLFGVGDLSAQRIRLFLCLQTQTTRVKKKRKGWCCDVSESIPETVYLEAPVRCYQSLLPRACAGVPLNAPRPSAVHCNAQKKAQTKIPSQSGSATYVAAFTGSVLLSSGCGVRSTDRELRPEGEAKAEALVLVGGERVRGEGE